MRQTAEFTNVLRPQSRVIALPGDTPVGLLSGNGDPTKIVILSNVCLNWALAPLAWY